MFEIIGIKKVDYVSKKTGKQVIGTELQCVTEDKRVEGLAVEKVYLKGNIDMSGLCLGAKFNPLYDRFGNVASLELID